MTDRPTTGATTPRLVLVAGWTDTARVDGITAAGTDVEAARHTPAADAELLAYGAPVRAPAVPASPSGCPTPALVTRAVREVVGFDLTVVDAGLPVPTAAPTVTVGARVGDDVRKAEPLPTGPDIRAAARQFGRSLSPAAGPVLLGESVPAGTTTALAVCRALGEDLAVSSSLPENPLDRKRRVVEDALAASNLTPGDCAGAPDGALRYAGDPTLAVCAGFVEGALSAGVEVTLAGGTQALAVVALLRHAGVEVPMEVATTSFVADDPTTDLSGDALGLGAEVRVTDPGFGGTGHPATERFAAGEAKEGVGMGGALGLAEDVGALSAVRRRVQALADRLAVTPADVPDRAGEAASVNNDEGGPS